MINLQHAKQPLMNNVLFHGLTLAQKQKILQTAETFAYAPEELIIQEGDVSQYIYLIKEGKVKVSKADPETGKLHVIATLKAGDVIGEVSLLDEAPRSASVYAETDTVLIGITTEQLQMLSQNEVQLISKVKNFFSKTKKISTLYEVILKNMATIVGRRFRQSNELLVEELKHELMHSKARLELGRVLINSVALLCFYMWVVEATASIQHTIISTSFLTVPLVLVFTASIFVLMKQSGFPLSFYGLNLKNWRKALVESLFVTFIVSLAIILYKYILIHTTAEYATHPLIEFTSTNRIAQTSLLFNASILLVYILFVPLQELIIRGVIQSSMFAFMVDPHKKFWSIVLPNLIFSINHIHLSLLDSFIVFIPGLLWGWLYSRHHTLLGVTISHLILGVFGLFVVNIFQA